MGDDSGTRRASSRDIVDGKSRCRWAKGNLRAVEAHCASDASKSSGEGGVGITAIDKCAQIGGAIEESTRKSIG